MHDQISITKKELYLIFMFNIIFALRMLGIFMVLPILSIYALSLSGSNEYFIGIAIGIYGIMQVIFQLPFGYISDIIGPRPVIITGLIISAIGSQIAALSNEIFGLILGRALQGSGAISSVLITVLLNSVKPQYRTQTMAALGITFGITFISSMILGPFIASKFGLHAIFQIITIITLISILLIFLVVPKKNHFFNPNNNNNINLKTTFNSIKLIVTHTGLFKLNLNIFCLHTVLTLNFIIWPKILISIGYPETVHFKVYAIIMFISILFLLLYIYFANKQYDKQKILIIFLNILFLSESIMFIMIHNSWLFLFGMQLFFIAFNLIESILPTLINKKSLIQYKNTTMSIYSIGQFLGIGLGGFLGGFLLETQGIQLVLIVALIITLINTIIK